MTEASESQLKEIYNDAGRPGAQAFRFAVKRAGHTITDKAAKTFVGKQAVGQVLGGGRACQAMGESRSFESIVSNSGRFVSLT